MLRKAIQKGWPALVVFIWPFLYFIDYVVSINGHFTGIGNDLRIVYYPYKPYLLDRLVHLNFPLWSPSEAVGFPFYSSPLTQTFYPLNIPLAIFYKLAGGLNLLDYQVYTILGIAIFALGLYFWLKTLGFNGRAILFAVLCMAVSFKVAETTRNANSIQELAWYPWILLALTRIFQVNTWKRLILYGLMLFFAMVCLFTAGYPYFMYYSAFLIGPYLLALVIPRLRKAFWGLPPVRIVRPVLVAAASAGSALLLCLPYLLEMQQLLKLSGERGGGTFEYATAHDFAFRDVVGSLIYPPSSQTEGWSYFGLIGLLLVILYFAGAFPVWGARKKSLDPLKVTVVSLYESWWVKAFFLLWFLLVTLVAMGKNSLLFVFLWKYMPFFQQLRVWGRVNIVLVPVLAWMVAAAYTGFERLIATRRDQAPGSRIARWRAEIILVIAYLVILGVQLYFWKSKAYDEYWINFMKVRSTPNSEELYIWVGAASFLVLLLVLVLSAFKNLGGVKSLSLIALVLVLGSAGEKRIFGGGVWREARTTEARQVYNIYDQDLMSLTFLRRDDCFELSLSPAFCVLPHENWYYNRYTDFYNRSSSEKDARDVLIGLKDGNRIYFSDSITHPTVTAFLADASRYSSFSQVKSYTADDLAITVKAPASGYISFIDNWDVDWKAEVDGKAVPIELLFGTFKSVHVSAGEHQVLFSYRPGVFWQINNLLLNLRTKLHFK
jgi:hypothetical protein